MIKATSVLALMGTVTQSLGKDLGMTSKKKMTTSRNARRGGGGGDLTEDIEFWTRMTQEVGSIPITTPRPTRRPASRKPTPFPSPPPTLIDTYEPTGGTPNPVTPSPVTPAPSTEEPTTSSPTETLICGLTPADRAEQFRQLALSVTDGSTLANPSSPQARALRWLIEEDKLEPPLCPDDGACRATQRYIMASFYFASDGGNWDQCNAPAKYTPGAITVANDQCLRAVTPFPVNNPRIGDKATHAWLTPVNECEWGGLACWGTDDNKNGCMDQIDFEADGIAGTLIPEMHELEELRFFILEQGGIQGPIPSEYGLFNKLLIFDMDFNQLTGEIPEELFNMDLLQQLDLNDNNLDGPISTKIGNLRTLTFLQLDHNKLSGNIPSQIGRLKALRIAFFNDNDLTGTVPEELCANRNNTSPPGFLGTLVVDCNPPGDPEVVCPDGCCSSCNVVE